MTTARLGRQPSTSQAELSHIALTLFVERGFDTVTVDDIAAAAGIGRRTFFRYFASKNDLPWGDFSSMLESMRHFLRSTPPGMTMTEAIYLAVVEFNRLPADEVPFHRRRMTLLLTVPTLAAHSTLRYAAWRDVVAEFAASRLGVERSSLEPQAIAWACLGLSLSAYEQWLLDDAADLAELLASAFTMMNRVFAADTPDA